MIEGLVYFELYSHPFNDVRFDWSGFTLKDLESVPFGVALPIREAIYRCREQPYSDWSEEVCLLIGRQDLTKQAHKMSLANNKTVSSVYPLLASGNIQFKASLK